MKEDADGYICQKRSTTHHNIRHQMLTPGIVSKEDGTRESIIVQANQEILDTNKNNWKICECIMTPHFSNTKYNKKNCFAKLLTFIAKKRFFFVFLSALTLFLKSTWLTKETMLKMMKNFDITVNDLGANISKAL